MGYHLQDRYRQRPETAPRTRVWRSEAPIGVFVRTSAPQPVEAHRPTRPAAAKPASGIPLWLSRDPIEERGGLNLYGFVGNDGVNRWDWLGMQGVRTTDRQVESDGGFLLAEGIANGTLTPIPGIHGKTFTAKDCPCAVEFKFEKAYQGTYDVLESRKLGGRPRREKRQGIYVKIQARPLAQDYAGETIKLIQVLRWRKVIPATVLEEERFEDVFPGAGWKDVLAGFNQEDQRDKSPGWYVDTLRENTSPYFTDTPFGNQSDGGSPAELWDPPQLSKPNAAREFVTCAFAGKMNLGCIRWGFYTDSKKGIHIRPNPPEPICGTPSELTHALNRWGGRKGKTSPWTE